MFNTLLVWSQKVIEEQGRPLPRCFAEVTRQFLKHGALWNEIDWGAMMPKDSLDIFPMLTSLGADYTSLDGRALQMAAVTKSLGALWWLLDAGVDVNATWATSTGPSTVLVHAIQEPWHPEIFRLLLQRGASLPADMHGKSHVQTLLSALRTYLGWCLKVRRDSSDNIYLGMVDVVLALEPDLSQLPTCGSDLLEACFIWYPDIGEETDCCLAAFSLLLGRGALMTPPALAILIGLGGRSDLVDQLIDAASGIHAYAIEQRRRIIYPGHGTRSMNQAFSPVQAAVYRKNWERIVLLLGRGADINQPAYRNRGVTALQAACQIEEKSLDRGTRLKMVKFLLGVGQTRTVHRHKGTDSPHYK